MKELSRVKGGIGVEVYAKPGPQEKYWDAEIETMNLRQIREYQLEQLKYMVRFCYENSPYYRAVFNEKGVNPDKINSLEDVKHLPFTNKQIERERQEAAPDFGDMICVPEEEIVYVSASSGSTGVPTISPFTAKDFDEFQDYQARLFWAIGMRAKDRYVHALNFTLFVGGPDVIGAMRTGALGVWAGAIPSERLLFILKSFKATITWTTPSYAWYLGETAQKEGMDPKKDFSLEKIIVAGEPGGSITSTRRAIEELWGVELYDFYGLSDLFGANAGMCECQNGLHIYEDHHIVEVLNPETMEPVGDMERGELVLTTLRKMARPMIRFRTGDIVTVTREKCECGRTHPRIMGIHGRLDDMLIITGVNVFPSDIEAVVRKDERLTGEYRMVVYKEEHLDRFDVEIEKLDAVEMDEEVLAQEVREVIKVRVGVSPKRVIVLKEGELPRATHKAKRVIDKRNKVWSD
ncbi:MAG: phenylacetate--CoA ligase [Deferribacteres bacterium]|nr:phenylacetate--CoA ligase [Deferribacteres bacterium]